jgi:hypothetical protein
MMTKIEVSKQTEEFDHGSEAQGLGHQDRLIANYSVKRNRLH